MTPEESEKLRNFVGKKADYYLKHWTNHEDPQPGKRKSAGFNIAAFFLTLFWLGYRKMYLLLAIVLALLLAEAVIEELLLQHVFHKEAFPKGWDKLQGILIATIFGYWGNRWYLRHARIKIREVELGSTSHDHTEAIAHAGGTSFIGMVGAILGMCIVLFAVLFLIYYFNLIE